MANKTGKESRSEMEDQSKLDRGRKPTEGFIYFVADEVDFVLVQCEDS